MIHTCFDCEHNEDDAYMEGEGARYCSIWMNHAKNRGKRNIGATFDCLHNCREGLCPRGFRL